MLTLTDLLDEYVDVTNDSSTTNRTRGKRRINQYQRLICSMKDFWWLEKLYTLTTVADQQDYRMPVTLRKPTSVTTTVGGISYPVRNLADVKSFDTISGLDGVSYTSDYPEYYIIRDNTISFYPIPSTSGNTITISGQAEAAPLQLEDYDTGTISVTNGSATVTGSGTTWVGNVQVGGYIFIDDIPYEISAVGSNTSITLYNTYEGVTAAGITYKAGDVSLVHEDYQDLLWLMAAEFQLGLKKAYRQQLEIITLHKRTLMDELMRNTTSATTENVWSPRRKNYFHPNTYPENIG